MSEAVNVGGAVTREIGFRPGPLFFVDARGRLMLQIGLDASSIIGPYVAKDKDFLEYQEAWFKFCDENEGFDLRTGKPKEANPLPQLDHDGDGKPGGSLPEKELPEAEEKAQIKARLLELGAGLPHPRSGLPRYRQALAEAEEEAAK